MSEIIHVEVEGLGRFDVPFHEDDNSVVAPHSLNEVLERILATMGVLLRQQRDILESCERMETAQQDRTDAPDELGTVMTRRRATTSRPQTGTLNATFTVRKVWVDRYPTGLRYRVLLPSGDKATTWDPAFGQKLVRAEKMSEVICLVYRRNREGHFHVLSVKTSAASREDSDSFEM